MLGARNRVGALGSGGSWSNWGLHTRSLHSWTPNTMGLVRTSGLNTNALEGMTGQTLGGSASYTVLRVNYGAATSECACTVGEGTANWEELERLGRSRLPGRSPSGPVPPGAFPAPARPPSPAAHPSGPTAVSPDPAPASAPPRVRSRLAAPAGNAASPPPSPERLRLGPAPSSRARAPGAARRRQRARSHVAEARRCGRPGL